MTKTKGGLHRVVGALPPEMFEYVRDEAKENERTLSAQVKYMIKQVMPQEEPSYWVER